MPYLGCWIVHDAVYRMDVEDMRGILFIQPSGGEKQKVVLARALAQQLKVRLLDEPTSALDIQNQYHVLKMVQNFCYTDNLIAVVVIHDLNLALRFCDHFLLMKDEQIDRHGDRSILDSEALKVVYTCDCCGETAGANWVRLAGDKMLCLDCYERYNRFNV